MTLGIPFVALSVEWQQLRDDMYRFDLVALDAAIASCEAERDRLYAADAMFLRFQNVGLDELDANLQARRVALDTANPSQAPHAVVYADDHISNGGHSATNWVIREKDLAPPPSPPASPFGAAVYSHAVAWDDEEEVLQGEDLADTFNRLRYLEGYGTAVAVAGFVATLDAMATYRALLVKRNAYFGM